MFHTHSLSLVPSARCSNVVVYGLVESLSACLCVCMPVLCACICAYCASVNLYMLNVLVNTCHMWVHVLDCFMNTDITEHTLQQYVRQLGWWSENSMWWIGWLWAVFVTVMSHDTCMVYIFKICVPGVCHCSVYITVTVSLAVQVFYVLLVYHSVT